MAIVKVINGAKSSDSALKNVLNYILRSDKTLDSICYVSGCWNDDVKITADNVYHEFKKEKRFWQKDSGRMYLHTVLSFHQNEKISAEQVLDFAKTWAKQVYPDHQHILSVHRDKGHLHCHIVVNTVSYIDGKKISISKWDLQRSKNLCNEMCIQRGLTVAQKGYHFDGTRREIGEVTAWSQEKYKLLQNEQKHSYLVDCGLSILDALSYSTNKELFIQSMKKAGWHTFWPEDKKRLYFENTLGEKVYGSQIAKTFNIPCTKEGLTVEFNRQKLRTEELNGYFRQVNDIAEGTICNNKELASRKLPDHCAESPERIRETAAYLRKLRDAESASEKNRKNCESERKNRDIESIRYSLEQSTENTRRNQRKRRIIERENGFDCER